MLAIKRRFMRIHIRAVRCRAVPTMCFVLCRVMLNFFYLGPAEHTWRAVPTMCVVSCRVMPNFFYLGLAEHTCRAVPTMCFVLCRAHLCHAHTAAEHTWRAVPTMCFVLCRAHLCHAHTCRAVNRAQEKKPNKLFFF